MSEQAKRVRCWKPGKAAKIEGKFIRQVCGLQTRAIRDKLHQSEIMGEFCAIMSSTEYKRLPHYSRHAIQTLHCLLFGWGERGMGPHTEYRMLGPDGKYYQDFATWRALFPDGNAALIDTGKIFWKETDKVYY